MKTKNATLIGLLAGASVLAIAAVTPVHAAGLTLSGANESVTIADDTDYVIIDNTFTATGDVTNQAVVGGSAPSNVGFLVDPAAIIDGDLINGASGAIYALSAVTTTAAAATAAAIGLSSDGALISAIVNNGLINASASAIGLDAQANATGLYQAAIDDGAGFATADLVNTSDLISFAAASAADAAGSASAAATALGVVQSASLAASASASITNSGNIVATALATAFATPANAAASANAIGISQTASGDSSSGASASADLVNSGSVSAFAHADAESLSGTNAIADADATGVSQSVSGGDGHAISVANQGSISATAEASALASGTPADAGAGARGVVQTFAATGGGAGATAGLDNDGTISASARAQAIGLADADAGAVEVNAAGDIAVDIDNQGTLSATADANGDGGAIAMARGLTIVSSGIISNAISNGGSISAIANGNAVLASPAGSFVTGSAFATGVTIDGTEFTGTFTNTGSITAEASGLTSWATGIRITGGGAGTEPGTIVNDGGTIAATYDTGKGAQRGVAIDTLNASSPIDIQLKGSVADGQIVGNLELSSDDTVEVTDGNTRVTGNINNGSLTVGSGGALWLQHGGASFGGGSIASVASYTQESDGILAIGVDADGTSSQINGGTVVLAGNMVVQLNAGLYADTMDYQDVVLSGAPIDTTWDDVSSLSPLMTASVVYNANDVDLTLTRVAFNDVAGLTRNQHQVATGFENAYLDPANSQAFNDLTGELFTLDDAAYPAALDSLSGVEHAVAGQQVMRSFRNLDGVLAGVHSRECESSAGGYTTSQVQGGNTITPVADLDVVDCGGAALWVRGQGLWANADGTSDSPGFDSTEFSLYGGADYTWATGTTLGMVLGYFNTDTDFDAGSEANFDGFQVGVYGQQDWNNFYARGAVAYGSAGVDVHRDIAVGTIAGTARSSYDDNVWYVNGEMGYDWAMGLEWVATPFAGLSYANLNGDNFNESGVDGADLSGSVDGDSVVSALGVRFGADWGTATDYWRPELSLAWEHEFGDFTTLNAAFIGAPASGFAVEGGDYGRDAAVVQAAFAYGWESVEFKLNYTGRWTQDYDDQAIYGQLTAKF
ncbi:MAG: autotransporter domain-containing protein [Hyphomicrobiales bacterium]